MVAYFSRMIKTQTQLPEDLYRRAKQFAAQREWSLAETFRRSIEEMSERYPARWDSADWTPPTPRVLECLPLDGDALKRLAQEDENEHALTVRHHGVTEFATTNVKDFKGFRFVRVWNPIELP